VVNIRKGHSVAMKPTELVRRLKRDMTLAIWHEAIDPLPSVRERMGVERMIAAAKLADLARRWNDTTVEKPLCEDK